MNSVWAFTAWRLGNGLRQRRPPGSGRFLERSEGRSLGNGAVVRLSIIVPAVGSQQDIDDTLVSVLEHRPESTQVVLVHPRGYVDPYDLHDEVEFVPAASDDLVSLCNAGFSASQAEVVGVFRPGVRWTEDGSGEILELFDQDRNLGSVAPTLVPEGSRTPIRGVTHHWARGKVCVSRARDEWSSPLLGAGFYRSTALTFMHGYNQAFTDLADVELGIRMSAAGYAHGQSQLKLSVQPLALPSPAGTLAAGRERARLVQLAADHGFASRPSMVGHLLAELACHGPGLKALCGAWGRMCEARQANADIPVRRLRDGETRSQRERQRTRRAA